MAKLTKLPARKEWSRQIWESLVCYANAPENRGGTSPQKLGAFKTALTRCMDWIGGGHEDLEACLDMKEGASLNDLETRYRANIRRVLTWLSAPDRHRELAARASQCLSVYAAGVRMNISENTSYKADADEPLLMEWPDPCESVVAPVCKFILEQIERHDLEEEAMRDVVPIGLCERSGCGRFFVIERVGRRRFCSDKCRAGAYQDKLTKEQRAARMRKYRATLKEQERGWIQKRKNRK